MDTTLDDTNMLGQQNPAAAEPESLEQIAAKLEQEEAAGAGSQSGAESETQGQTDGASDDDLGIFSLSDAYEAEEGQEGAESAESKEEGKEEEYQFDLGEQTQIPEVIHGQLGTMAQKLGVPGDKAAALLNRGLEIYQEAHREAMKKSLADLREDWGDKFTANVKATKAFIARLGKAAGLAVNELAALECPHGMRLMNALRVQLNETGAYAGAPQSAPKLTPQQQIDAIFSDPVKAEAMLDPGHPQYRAVHAELDRLYSIRS